MCIRHANAVAVTTSCAVSVNRTMSGLRFTPTRETVQREREA